jgi:hypothetical protein
VRSEGLMPADVKDSSGAVSRAAAYCCYLGSNLPVSWSIDWVASCRLKQESCYLLKRKIVESKSNSAILVASQISRASAWRLNEARGGEGLSQQPLGENLHSRHYLSLSKYQLVNFLPFLGPPWAVGSQVAPDSLAWKCFSKTIFPARVNFQQR